MEPGHEFQIPEGGILVIEGIHALNPQYTKTLSAEKVLFAGLVLVIVDGRNKCLDCLDTYLLS